MRQHGTVAWSELLTTDPQAALLFYERALGWTFDAFDLDGRTYWLITSGDTRVGGLGGMDAADEPGSSSYWLTSIEVDDVDARFERAIALGASAIAPPHDVPGVGRVATLRDPTGGLVSWITGAS